MNGYWLRSARAIAILVTVTMVLTALPSALPAKAASASTESAAVTEVKVGLLSDVQYWNPMNLFYAEDWIPCYMIFSSLWTLDEDYQKPVPDLVKTWTLTLNPNGTETLAFDITSNAYFRNKGNPTDMSHKLTTRDVEYTIRAIQDNPGGGWDLYVQNITWIRILSDTSMELILNEQIATIVTDLAQFPVIPQFQWETKPGQFLAEPNNPTWLMGSGPFYLQEKTTTYFRLIRAPNYHGAIDYPGERDVSIGSVLFTVYGGPEGLVNAINSGFEDCADLRGALNLFLNALGVGNPYIVKQATLEPGFTDIAINAMPMDFRKPNYGQGNPLLLDWYVRQAIGMTLDRDTILNVIMAGKATPADSVQPPGWWHLNLTLDPYDPDQARSILEAHGYSDTDGDTYLEVTDQVWWYGQEPWGDIGDELSFELHATNNEPDRMSIGENWVDWAAQAGIRFNYAALEEWPTMTNEDWFKCMYDVWIWHWGMYPEPLVNLEYWLTSEIKATGSNCQMPMGPWWYSPVNSTTGKGYSAYDENWTLARHTQDIYDRRDLVFKLQQWVYDSRTEFPPYYDLGLYGYSNERFVGWGDWEAHPGRPPSYSGVEWLWFDLEPVANVPPMFTIRLASEYTAVPRDPVAFQVEVWDAESDKLWLNWTYGDSSPVEGDVLAAGTTSTPKTVTRTHTYSSVGDYEVVVTLTDGISGHLKQLTSLVHIVTTPDNPPTIKNPPGCSPGPPQYTGTTVDWWVNVSDDNANKLGFRITWDWGDGSFDVANYKVPKGKTVTDHRTHSWVAGGTYNVAVYVYDFVADPRHNQTSYTPYEIIEDTPPYDLSVSPISGNEDSWITCVANGMDHDPFDLRFTWAWDDGSFNVTDHVNSLIDQPVTSMVSHMWPTPGSYQVTVYLDDLTGYVTHNISQTIDADISVAGANVAPTAPVLTIAPADPAQRFEGVDLTFNASAIDADSDAMIVYIEFGDGSAAVGATPGGMTTRQYVDPEFTHAYTTAGTYDVNVSFDDGQNHNVTITQAVTIIVPPANQAPWLQIQTAYGTSWNVSLTITPLRCLDNDTDPLDAWYDWGDGTWSEGDAGADYASTHNYTAAPGEYTLTVYANDGQGHNVSKSATVIVTDNLKPTIVSLTKAPVKAEYNETEELTFTVIVRDYEGDMVNLTVEFGDGEKAYSEFTPTASTNTTRTFAHTYGVGSARIDPYLVNVTAKDNKTHYSMVWSRVTASLRVVAPEEETPEEEGAFPWALVAGVAILLIIVIVVVALLLRRRKKGGAEEKAAMEGMAPPEPPPPA